MVVPKMEFAQLDYKNMKIISRISFGFSNCYDLITIGPYANRVAKAVVSYENSIKALTIEEDNHIMEPSLTSVGSPRVALQQRNSTFSDIEMGVGVREIDPDTSCVILKNGAKYFYKNLVYSGNPSDWKGFSCSKQQSRRLKSSFIHNDVDYENIGELFARRGGSLVFTVPKDTHFGCQNYFMMLLRDRIKQNKATAPFETDPLKITVLCEGSSLVPFNQAYNRLLEDYLKEHKIRLIKNAEYSVNVQRRQIKMNKSKSTLNFDSLFEYLPLKVPQVLQQSNINPFQTNRHTLCHSKYENIFLLANIVNNVYTLSAVSQMSRIIGQNVIYRSLGIQKRSIYQGYSRVNIWLSQRECHQIVTDYNGAKLAQDLGCMPAAKRMTTVFHKNFLRSMTQRSINSGLNLFSKFSQSETINTERHQVPALYRGDTIFQ